MIREVCEEDAIQVSAITEYDAQAQWTWQRTDGGTQDGTRLRVRIWGKAKENLEL